MIAFLMWIIDLIANLVFVLILVHVIISYFMKPWHPFRMWVDRIVNPMLAPIRRAMPTIGMFDFSPIILLLLVQVLAAVMKRILLIFV
ncbi:MAG TPA: YggT family protein [Anaerolineales bacterium]|nr:YggT family protein [Anaerolineales bacterium]